MGSGSSQPLAAHRYSTTPSKLSQWTANALPLAATAAARVGLDCKSCKSGSKLSRTGSRPPSKYRCSRWRSKGMKNSDDECSTCTTVPPQRSSERSRDE